MLCHHNISTVPLVRSLCCRLRERSFAVRLISFGTVGNQQLHNVCAVKLIRPPQWTAPVLGANSRLHNKQYPQSERMPLPGGRGRDHVCGATHHTRLCVDELFQLSITVARHKLEQTRRQRGVLHSETGHVRVKLSMLPEKKSTESCLPLRGEVNDGVLNGRQLEVVIGVRVVDVFVDIDLVKVVDFRIHVVVPRRTARCVGVQTAELATAHACVILFLVCASFFGCRGVGVEVLKLDAAGTS